MLRHLAVILPCVLVVACGGPDGETFEDESTGEDLVSEKEDAATTQTNLNSASWSSLDRLPYVTPTLAKAIVSDRTARGPFWKTTDVLRVRGMTQAIYGKIKAKVTVGTSCRRDAGPACARGTYCRVRNEDAGSYSATGLCLPSQAPTGGQCTCSAQYQPVCGSDGQTYSNACRAGCANVSYTLGACQPAPSQCVCRSNCAQQVCGGDGRTYANASEAACAGTYVRSYGACR